MKLELGMYVRTKELHEVVIVKVLKVTNDGFNADNNMFYEFSEVIKASHNIIDLIEVDDIVQIKESIDNYSKSYFIGIDEMATLRTIKERIENGNLILENVLTKEQFENNCYKIGD